MGTRAFPFRGRFRRNGQSRAMSRVAFATGDLPREVHFQFRGKQYYITFRDRCTIPMTKFFELLSLASFGTPNQVSGTERQAALMPGLRPDSRPVKNPWLIFGHYLPLVSHHRVVARHAIRRGL